MPIEIKICGINSKNIIQTITQNGGCQYLGFVFSQGDSKEKVMESVMGSVTDSLPSVDLPEMTGPAMRSLPTPPAQL